MKANYFTVILEGLRSDFKAVVEGLTVLDNKIDSVEKRLMIEIDGLKSQINFVYTNLSGRIDAVENNLSALMNRVDGLDCNLTNKIDRTMDRIENHELRLIKLEKRPSSC